MTPDFYLCTTDGVQGHGTCCWYCGSTDVEWGEPMKYARAVGRETPNPIAELVSNV